MARVHPTGGTAVTSGYRTAARPDHSAVDFRATIGTPLYASQSGTIKTGTGHSRAGTWVEIHRNGTIAGYSHLSKRNVTAGQHVNAGDIIGWSGATGNVTGPHLHFYVKTLGVYRNPLNWLNESEIPATPTTPGGTFNKKTLEYQERNNRYGDAGLVPDGKRGAFTIAWENWVGHAQTELNKWKSTRPDIAVDKDYGPNTHTRVRELESRNSLPVNGILSNTDAAYMRKHGSSLPNRPKTH